MNHRRVVLRSIMTLQILACLGSLIIGPLPGWKMFARVESVTTSLFDHEGHEIDVRKWLPFPAYNVNDRDVKRIGAFLCATHAEFAPLVIQNSEHHVIATTEGCEWHDTP